MESLKYPIAETFASLQGEGTFVGTRMLFVRLAGCNVGVYKQNESHPSGIQILQNKRPGHSICQTAIGQHFICDTLYQKTDSLSVQEIVDRSGDIPHLCITGGEPFLHDLNPIVDAFCKKTRSMGIRHDICVHIETSGTLPFDDDVVGNELVWVTCSPKRLPDGSMGALHANAEYVSEWKFVVGVGMELLNLEMEIEAIVDNNPFAPVYIQAANDVNSFFDYNVDVAMKLIERNPEWRYSPQLHKYLGQR